MRMLLKIDMNLEAGNEAIRSGKMAEFNQSLMERIQPEAAYFSTENGTRTSYIFFDLQDPSQIPAIAEPLFQNLGARVEFIPVMNGDDLQKGLAGLSDS